MEDAIRDKLKKILMQELNLAEVKDNACQDDYGAWDSLAYMSIVARVEDEFHIEATHENIEKFNSVDNLISIITE